MATASLRLHKRRTGERVIKGALLACGVLSIVTTIGIVLSLVFETVEFFREVPILDYLTGTHWNPTIKPASFGVLPLVTATVKVAVIAIVFATPVGIGAAIYLSEYARPRVRKVIKPILEILAGIPSVVFGYFALNFVTLVLLRKAMPGINVFNNLSAGLVVGVAIIPVIASLAEDAMRAVPYSLREAAYGMGATKRVVATKVVVPAALSGIAAGVILGLSRAIGESMIVAIAGGGLAQLTADPREPASTMTAFIVQLAQSDTPAGSIAYKTIFVVGSTLFLLTLVLNILSVRIVRRFREQYE